MTTPTIALTIAVGSTGAVPTSPDAIRAQLTAYIASLNPGYTILPAALIEDILSTDIGAIVLCDSAAIDLINSLTPDSSNPWLLTKLGAIYGVALGKNTNTSVFVVFAGTVGFVIAKGFTVSDGTYQYTIQDGGVIGAGGVSPPLFCVATQTGTWAVPAGTVTTLITSAPSGITLTVSNPNTGTPSPGAQTEASYRSQVMQAGLAASQGMASYLKTLLGQVVGVQPRLVSPVQVNGGGWEIIVGGGDPYQVAYAVYSALFDISSLVGSTLAVTGVTNANPGVVTTNLNHGLVTGQTNVKIAGVVGTAGVNGGPYTVTVTGQKTFSFGVDTTAGGAYASGGVVTPNNRNVSVNLTDYPNTYTVPIVNPPQQTVLVQLTWNTSSPNFVSATAVSQLGAQALSDYINTIPVGQPMNLFTLQEVFQLAVVSLIPINLLTRMVFTVSINGVATAPSAGTGIIAGDPESYFACSPSNIIITQG